MDLVRCLHRLICRRTHIAQDTFEARDECVDGACHDTDLIGMARRKAMRQITLDQMIHRQDHIIDALFEVAIKTILKSKDDGARKHQWQRDDPNDLVHISLDVCFRL
jgi:hypothetical protein